MLKHQLKVGYVAGLTAVLFATIGSTLVPCVAEDSELEATVRDAWKSRQELSKSLNFEWTEELTLTGDFVPSRRTRATDGAKQPVQMPAVCQLLLFGDRGRYHEKRRSSAKATASIPPEIIHVINGRESRELHPQTKFKFPLATVKLDADLSELYAPEGAIPIALTYRILHPDFKVFRVNSMTVEEKKTKDGRVVTATMPVGTSHVELWLSPERDYVVTRSLFVVASGKTEGDTRISYRRDEQYGWIPSEWTSRHALGVRHCKVTDYAINPKLADSEFKLDFPPGTWVNEMPTNISYVIGPNGEKKIVRRAEVKPIQMPIRKPKQTPNEA